MTPQLSFGYLPQQQTAAMPRRRVCDLPAEERPYCFHHHEQASGERVIHFPGEGSVLFIELSCTVYTMKKMTLLSQQDITKALTRLGELAQEQEHQIELLAIGGAVMVLEYNARLATHDVDVFILMPKEARIARSLARQVAQELEWPDDWLNDGAKGFLVGVSQGPVIFSAPGIVVRRPELAQLLAMKLSAWRDDVDIEDARRLLQELTGTQDEI